MFNRRTLVALTACLVLTASTAMAGGNGGSKKDSTIRVHNNTDEFGPETLLYVFVDVPNGKIQTAAGSSDPIREFNRLGGKPLNPGGHHSFKVKAGDDILVTAIDIDAQDLFGQQEVDTEKGETVDVYFPEGSSF